MMKKHLKIPTKPLQRRSCTAVRDYYNIPFSPNSGFQSLALNRLLGSKDTSQHVLGQAVDMKVPTINNFELMEFISSNLNFDQVILEFYNEDDPKSGWVHVSYDRDKDTTDTVYWLTTAKSIRYYGTNTRTKLRKLFRFNYRDY